MKPRKKLAESTTPDGGLMVLFQHDRDFLIEVNGEQLMVSRHHESELELARLGCAHLVGRPQPAVLIGGLGMGYTLRQALDLVGPEAELVVGELMAAVVDWNRRYLGELNGHPLADPRVVLEAGDVIGLLNRSRARFDAILLDIDNGPRAMTDAANNRLYAYSGIVACQRALRKKGTLAVWSAEPSRDYEDQLLSCGFHVRRYRVPAYKGSSSLSRFVFVASENEKNLPPGGGEPRRAKPSMPFHRKKGAGRERG